MEKAKANASPETEAKAAKAAAEYHQQMKEARSSGIMSREGLKAHDKATKAKENYWKLTGKELTNAVAADAHRNGKGDGRSVKK